MALPTATACPSHARPARCSANHCLCNALTRALHQVRRAKLYYLRDRVGKAARLKQVFTSTKAETAAAKAAAAATGGAAVEATAKAAAPEPVAVAA